MECVFAWFCDIAKELKSEARGMQKAFQNQAEFDVSEMLISLQTCDKNEARDGGVESMQKTIRKPCSNAYVRIEIHS